MISLVRGLGLWVGIVLTTPVAGPVEAQLRDAGFLVNAAAPDVLRLAPPLVVTPEQLDAFVLALATALDQHALPSAARPAARVHS